MTRTFRGISLTFLIVAIRVLKNEHGFWPHLVGEQRAAFPCQEADPSVAPLKKGR
jgi:hypothetical protein